jgi:hypothetical protein
MVESYFTHNPSNVTYMQMVRSNSNMRSRRSISRQCNFPFYNKSSNTLKSNINMLLKKTECKKTKINDLPIVYHGKTITLPDKTIHIMLGCVMHLHGHQNKVVPFMKPFILVNPSNGTNFCNCTYSSTNNIHNHRLSCQFNNDHIDKKDLVFMSHVNIGL